ncbi:hypothetical protein [Chitinophaga sp. 212800010-3]|uniref:hypothetical protein n=1 Tax=unclassified Chitinophaga TaxID=2619133 RepID=UPI002E0DA7E0
MKRIKGMITLVLLTLGITAGAQRKLAGVYLTEADYLNNHPAYSHATVNLHSLIPGNYITIQEANRHVRLDKNKFFALKLANGTSWRLTKSSSYEILNSNPRLLLYRRKIPVSPKVFPDNLYCYYFSAAGGQLKALTAWNIKQAFTENGTLADQLDATFKNDESLMAYDAFHHMYKLEWLLK